MNSSDLQDQFDMMNFQTESTLMSFIKTLIEVVKTQEQDIDNLRARLERIERQET
jgi:hypothetical protein